MDLLHLHLLLNHVPVIGIPIGAALLGWGLLKHERAVQRAALALLVLVGLSASAVFLTGEPAEERVENLPGVATQMIERHESAGKLAVAASHLVWIVAAAGLFASRRQRPLPRGIALTSFVAAMIAIAAVTPAAYLGGRIRHTEIGGTAGAAVQAPDDERR